jgi:hypothetical protein
MVKRTRRGNQPNRALSVRTCPVVASPTSPKARTREIARAMKKTRILMNAG